MPGVLQLAAKSMKMTTEQFLAAMERGEVGAKEFLPVFTKALREMAAPGLDKAFESMNVAFKKMVQSAKLFVKALFESGVGDIFTSLFNILNNIFDIMQPFISLFGGFLAGILKPIVFTLEFLTGLMSKFITMIDEALGGKLNSLMAGIGEVAGFVLGILGKLGSIIAWIGGKIGQLLNFTLTGKIGSRLSQNQGAAGEIFNSTKNVAQKAGSMAVRGLDSRAYQGMAGAVGGAELYQQKVAVEFTGPARDALRQNSRESTVRTINTNSRP